MTKKLVLTSCHQAPSLLTVHTITKILERPYCMKGQGWKYIVERKEKMRV